MGLVSLFIIQPTIHCRPICQYTFFCTLMSLYAIGRSYVNECLLVMILYGMLKRKES